MTVISVANNKGGVGKTTTTLNIGAALADLNRRVLLVDLDPQASLTIYMGYDPASFERNTYHLMTRRASPSDIVCSGKNTYLDLLPASIELASAEIEISAAFSREMILKEQLEKVSDFYDVVLIDNMPSLGVFTVNSLMASDYVLVPVEPTYLAYKGLEMISSTISAVSRYNPRLSMLGTVITMVDDRTRHSREIMQKIRESYPVFEPPIRRSVKFADASLNGASIADYAGDQFEGSQGYAQIARQIVALIDGAPQM
ncbi:MAG: ParA family protein [Ruminococcaceae bacterium]|nr:ParA family protein [Oscillospiraceae bacterium]